MSMVALSFGDCYLHLATDDHGPVLRADAPLLTADALFERVDLRHGRVALVTPDGRYLAARPSGTASSGLRPEDDLTACAAFEEVRWADGSVSFLTCDRTYLGVDGEGLVLGDRISGGSCERFEYVEAPAGLAPPSRPTTPRPRIAGEQSPVLS